MDISKDITIDFPLIEYLKNGILPHDLEDNDLKALKLKADDFYFEEGRLRYKATTAIVPTITERKVLLASVHDHLGHTQFDSLYNAISADNYWTTMRTDI